MVLVLLVAVLHVLKVNLKRLLETKLLKSWLVLLVKLDTLPLMKLLLNVDFALKVIMVLLSIVLLHVGAAPLDFILL